MDRMIEFASNHWILFSALGLMVYLLLQDLVETLMGKHKTVSAIGAVELMNKDQVTVIDVREASEFIKSHIEDSVNMASTKLDKKINELDKYKNDLVIVACQTGTRSPAACSKLIKNGFTNVHLLKGGIQAWEDLNLPIRKSKPKHRA